MFEILRTILKGMGIFLAVLVPFAGFFYMLANPEKKIVRIIAGAFAAVLALFVFYMIGKSF